MAEVKKITGFMPRRFSFNSTPSSYSLQFISRDAKLELEKIWEAKERAKKASLIPPPANADTLGKQAA